MCVIVDHCQDCNTERKPTDQTTVNNLENQSPVDQDDHKTSHGGQDTDHNQKITCEKDQNEQETQIGVQETMENDHKVGLDDQRSPVLDPEKKLSDQQPSGSKSEQTNQSDQGETIDNQMGATSKKSDQSTNEDTKSNQDQDKIKADQDEVTPPSTPPHMISGASGDSQATEIINSDASSGNGSDNEYETPGQSGSDRQQHSSDDEEERKYDRPWCKPWGSSSDKPVSVHITRCCHQHTDCL